MKSKILLLIFAIGSLSVSAQEKLADKFFKNYGYVKATELYEEVLKKGDTSINVLTKLGDCYYNNSKPEKAAFWYGKAFDKYGKDDINPEYMYKYVQSLRSQNDFEKADEWMEKFMMVQNNDTGANSYNAENISKYREMEDPERNRVVKLSNLPFNSEYSDFGTYIQDGKLFFTSARNTDGNKIYGWNQEPFLDLYQIDVTKGIDSSEYGTPIQVPSKNLNTRFHEASVSITNDGKTMYFTRDNMSGKNRVDYDREGTTYLQIYKARLIDGIWQQI